MNPSRVPCKFAIWPSTGRKNRVMVSSPVLAWSMDKIGPIARSIEDCALVFGAIHGADAHDITAVDRPFAWSHEQGGSHFLSASASIDAGGNLICSFKEAGLGTTLAN